MSDLPAGWAVATLDELAETSLGKMLDKKKATGKHPTPYLRNINVRWGLFDLSDVASMDIRPDELDRVLAKPGDVIACEGGEPGRAAVWQGPDPIALQKALHRIRPASPLVSKFLAFFLEHAARSRILEPLLTGTTIKHLPQEKLRRLEIRLPPVPEQERIVAAIEEHFSRLDAADGLLASVCRRATLLHASALEAAWRASGERIPLAEVGSIVTGATPKATNPAHWGDAFPFVTPGDLTPGGVVTQSERWLSNEGRSAAREVPSGAVLVTCIGATLGKASLAKVPMATNQQINSVVVDESVADSRFVLAALASPSGVRMLRSAASSTTMPILNKTGFGRLEIPNPPLEIQRQLADEADLWRDAHSRVRDEIASVARLAGHLRRAIFAAAFSGQLVPQDRSDEPASVLLERIRQSRADASSAPRRRRAKAKA